MRCQQFKLAFSRRGGWIKWYVLDRLSSASLASGEERSKGAADQKAREQMHELAARFAPASALLK